VAGAARLLPPLHPFAHLVALVGIGGASYALALLIAARPVINELFALLRSRQAPAAAQAV